MAATSIIFTVELTMAKQKHHKLLLKYFLSFGALAKVGPVVYKLRLLADNRRHDVFHVPLLKDYEGS